MKKVFTAYLLSLSLTGFAQAKFEPFRLAILKPDTAIVDQSLNQFKDRIVKQHIEKYNRRVKTYQDMANCKTCDFAKEDIERYKQTAELLKKLEGEVKKFQYFEVLSAFSAEIYDFYFNEYDPFSIVTELSASDTAKASLKELSASSNADYLVFFGQVHTVFKNGLPQLQLQTSLYSRKEDKVILSVQTNGDGNSRGEMWECTNPLECLFVNAVRTSTNEVSDLLRKLQAKKQ